jgi:hypothetical protein
MHLFQRDPGPLVQTNRGFASPRTAAPGTIPRPLNSHLAIAAKPKQLGTFRIPGVLLNLFRGKTLVEIQQHFCPTIDFHVERGVQQFLEFTPLLRGQLPGLDSWQREIPPQFVFSIRL